MALSQPQLRLVNRACWTLALAVVAIPFVFAFLWMVSAGFKSASEIFGSPSLVPRVWRWQNFVDVFTYQLFARQYLNSLYIAVTVTLLTLVVSSLAGYALARLRLAGAALIGLFLVSALMVPEEVTIIPNFFLMRWLGVMDTHWPLILLPVFGPQGIVCTFLMRQYFLALPKELEEAGKMDGLSRFGVWWRIALPMSRPALARRRDHHLPQVVEPVSRAADLPVVPREVHAAAGALELHRSLRDAALAPAACGDQPRGGADPDRLSDRPAADHRKLRPLGREGLMP